jgi:hypothetical protein
VQPDILKDLLKVDVPDIRKSVDRARDALKTLTLVAGINDEEKILEAQDVCENTIDWIALVEGRCKAAQLHLDVKQQPSKVDFVPFKPGTGVSIHEFFHKFVSWARGRMPLDQKANVLYNRHLDPAIKDGNKELEDAKEDYQTMKAILIEKYGTPDVVCNQYLECINRLTMPTNSKNKTELLAYTKNMYSSLTSLTKVEIDRGQKVPGLADCYLLNQFLKKIHRTLPERLASKFLFQLQENGESYHLMKGEVYMDRILNLLRCSYKSLEIELEETSKPAAASKVKPAKQISVNAAVITNGYTSSSSSDDQARLPLQSKPKRKKKTKPTPSTQPSQPTAGALAAVPASANQLVQPGHTIATHPTIQFCRGPRWACPVQGHTGHDLADCLEFWGAWDCAARRKMIFRSGCPSCLGKDQGCQDGRCDIIYQLPPDVMCGSCVKSCLPGKSPLNKMTCDIVWHKKLPANVVTDVMESWVPNLNIGRLIRNKSMSLNMFGMNMFVPPCDSPPPRAEVSPECRPGELMRRVKRLEDALSAAAESRAAEMEIIQRNIVAERMEVDRQFAKLRKQLRDQEDRISELESSNARLKASCATADAASQTDPTPSQEYETPTAALDTEKDASCDARSNNPEAVDNGTNEDQTSVLPYIKPKKKLKPRKNRSRGARSRAKAAAALALLEAETVTSTLSTKDSPVPATEAIATLILTESKVAALVCREGLFIRPYNELAVAQGPKIHQKNEL